MFVGKKGENQNPLMITHRNATLRKLSNECKQQINLLWMSSTGEGGNWETRQEVNEGLKTVSHRRRRNDCLKTPVAVKHKSMRLLLIPTFLNN